MTARTDAPCGDHCIYNSLTRTGRSLCLSTPKLTAATQVLLCTMEILSQRKASLPFLLVLQVTSISQRLHNIGKRQLFFFLVLWMWHSHLSFLACDACQKWTVKGRGERNVTWVKSNLNDMFIFPLLLNKEGKGSFAGEEIWVKFC